MRFGPGYTPDVIKWLLAANVVCFLAAFILFVIEAWWHKSLTAAGLAAWVLVAVVDTADAL